MKNNNLIFLLFFQLVFGCSLASIKKPKEFGFPRLIAHAFGGIDQAVYTNSLEAFKLSYQKGFRLFETDLWLASDGKVVLFHDGFEKNFHLTDKFGSKDFLSKKIYNKYTPMGLEELVNIFVQFPDWTLVTDVKNEHRQVLTLLCAALKQKNIDCKKRLLPQFYNAKEDFQMMKSFGFTKLIFTLYMTNISDKDLLEFIKNNKEISVITMSTLRWNKKLVSDINELGIKVFVHTVNEKAEFTELQKDGVWGIYTDFLTP